MYIGIVNEIKKTDKAVQQNFIIHELKMKLTDKIKLRTINFTCVPNYSSLLNLSRKNSVNSCV